MVAPFWRLDQFALIDPEPEQDLAVKRLGFDELMGVDPFVRIVGREEFPFSRDLFALPEFAFHPDAVLNRVLGNIEICENAHDLGVARESGVVRIEVGYLAP
jgi:hypothetical protein